MREFWRIVQRAASSCFHGLLLAIIIIVVAVKEIYDDNRDRMPSCTENSDFHKELMSRIDDPNEFSAGKEEFNYCYFFRLSQSRLHACRINIGIVPEGTLDEIEENSGLFRIEVMAESRSFVDQTISGRVHVDIVNQYFDQDLDGIGGSYGGFELWTTEEIKPDTKNQSTSTLADSVNLMKYILGGLCGGLLALILIMFIFTRFIYPRLNGNAVTNHPTSSTIVTSDHGRNLPGLTDLPPNYENIGEYEKVETMPSSSSPPPPYIDPPTYGEIGSALKTAV